MKSLSIVMPAFNEAKNIPKMIEACLAFIQRQQIQAEIIVVDDGSTDDTNAVLSSLQQMHPELRILHNEMNRGYGYSLHRAIAASEGELVATIDSDGQFDINDLSALLPLYNDKVGAVTGYRRQKQDSVTKVMGDRILNLLMRLLFGLKLRDSNCALKLYRGTIIRSIRIESNGFSTPTEIMVRLQQKKYHLVEYPVSHFPRSAGKSSLNTLRTSIHMLLFLLYLRLQLCLISKTIIREP